MTDFITMEKLQIDGGSLASVLRYDDHVIYTRMVWNGTYIVRIYEFVDEPDKDFDAFECRLNIIDSNENFKDAGHAVSWAIGMIEELEK